MYSHHHQVNGELMNDRKRQLVEAVNLLSSRKQLKTGLTTTSSSPATAASSEHHFGLSNGFFPLESSSTDNNGGAGISPHARTLLSNSLQRNLGGAMSSLPEMRLKAKLLEASSRIMAEAQLSAILRSQEEATEAQISAILRGQEEARASRTRDELFRQLVMLPPAGNSRFGSQLCGTTSSLPMTNSARLPSSNEEQTFSNFIADFLARSGTPDNAMTTTPSSSQQQLEVAAQCKKQAAAAAKCPTYCYTTTLQTGNTEKSAGTASSKGTLETKSDDSIHISLSIDEDQNWLSEFQCYLRSELIEIATASRQGLDSQSNSAGVYQQVGIRCRYCAHLPPGEKVSRSSAFPTTIRQLYQSFTMMQREHFHKCPSVPEHKKQRLEALKNINMQGACDSKQYWVHAAQRLGMVDTPRGIEITPESKAKGKLLSNFGTGLEAGLPPPPKDEPEFLVTPMDEQTTHPFLYMLLSQLQVISLAPSERTGKRRTLDVGLKGFGCCYCSKAGRFGFSRTYPLRRRTLPAKLNDMFYHLQRCTLCPTEVKVALRRQCNEGQIAEHNSDLFERIWKQLGREGDITT